MEITEKERLILVMKKNEIRKLAESILETSSSRASEVEIKKKVTGILSLISTIASYSNSKNYSVDGIGEMANSIFSLLDTEAYVIADCMLEVFCNTANSIRFDFTKKDLKINIPKIDLSIFRKG